MEISISVRKEMTMFEWWNEFVTGLGQGALLTTTLIIGGKILILALLCIVADLITRRIILTAVRRIVARSQTDIDDIFLKRGVFTRLSHLMPGLLIYLFGPGIFGGDSFLGIACKRGGLIFILLVLTMTFSAFLNSLIDIYRNTSISRQRPIKSYVQVVKIITYVAMGITIFSALLDKSPAVLLGGIGAMTAVIMLVFKDSILGFVAGIQLSANEMLAMGDWIAMPNYGADGTVTDITLTTVKVQNWDKTITTIPAYSLISDSFKNWRGMEESGGRRIKRALNIDLSSIRFIDREELDRYKRFQLLSDYIVEKEGELSTWNSENGIDESVPVNGRRLTNIGSFRAYVVAYLKSHPLIHDQMTFLVRQLTPTPQGLPLEIYVFSRDQEWANYEAIQADIFDHILAVVPEFGLRVYQQPTGADVLLMGQGETAKS